MEELLLSGALVEFEYQEVNFTGTPDSKTFVGRMISFDYNREGGNMTGRLTQPHSSERRDLVLDVIRRLLRLKKNNFEDNTYIGESPTVKHEHNRSKKGEGKNTTHAEP